MNRISMIIKFHTVIGAVLCLTTIVVVLAATTDKKCNFKSIRLPERVKPTHYDLLLKLIDVFAPTYEGQVKINVTIGQLDEKCLPTSRRSLLEKISFMRGLPFGCDPTEIVLNVNDRVHIKQAKFIILDTRETTIESLEICRDDKNEMASIRFDRSLEVDSRGQLIIDFSVFAGVNEKDEGSYKSIWEDEARNESYVSYVTQFEAAHARKAFPCFDEPAFKATFDVIIEHERNLTALANTMPVREELVLADGNNNKDLVRTVFDRTPVMSTYLLAFAVGQYDHLESKIMDEKVLLRVFTPPGHQNLGRIALDMGRRAYAALHDYFDIEQPLEKVDFLPFKIASGSAMENWGLVTIKDDLLLVDDENKSQDDQHIMFLAKVISHELAHQWFGNLVTMRWWDNLWLNEAFADWLAYVIADRIQPEYSLNIMGLERQQIRGLDADADSSRSHPIKNPNLKTIQDIEDSFDSITYAKGSAVVRMLEGYVGRETFKLAIRDYLNKFKYQNTDEKDLWNVMEARSQLPVGQMMDNWLNQAGFPLVSVKFTPDGKGIHIRQDKFGERSFWQSKKQLWMIPINMLVMRGDQPGVDEPEVIKFMLSDREQQVSLPEWFDPSKGHWLKLNADAEGFFRVRYDPAVLELMIAPIRSKQMDVINRINMLDDMRALFMIRNVGSNSVDQLLSPFEGEEHPILVIYIAKLVYMLATIDDGPLNRHQLLLNYFNNMVVKDTKKLWDKTNQDWYSKRAVLMTLIDLDYEPAIEFGRNTLAEMNEEEKSNFSELEEVLSKKQTPKQ